MILDSGDNMYRRDHILLVFRVCGFLFAAPFTIPHNCSITYSALKNAHNNY